MTSSSVWTEASCWEKLFQLWSPWCGQGRQSSLESRVMIWKYWRNCLMTSKLTLSSHTQDLIYMTFHSRNMFLISWYVAQKLLLKIESKWIHMNMNWISGEGDRYNQCISCCDGSADNERPSILAPGFPTGQGKGSHCLRIGKESWNNTRKSSLGIQLEAKGHEHYNHTSEHANTGDSAGKPGNCNQAFDGEGWRDLWIIDRVIFSTPTLLLGRSWSRGIQEVEETGKLGLRFHSN